MKTVCHEKAETEQRSDERQTAIDSPSQYLENITCLIKVKPVSRSPESPKVKFVHVSRKANITLNNFHYLGNCDARKKQWMGNTISHRTIVAKFDPGSVVKAPEVIEGRKCCFSCFFFANGFSSVNDRIIWTQSCSSRPDE